ncbi:E3 ubiquitin-protein ligase TRIM33-like [Argopecten irradians]|uniref:E3 ubiquitin-protein ligase TRIM33-like n=1 Tax=Argopecten irradians TaxID=31199 RepID=UPI00372243D5
MAESRAFSSGDDSSLGRLLQCPICLGQFRQPKSLPCLHSFCEECLGTYITQHLSGDTAAGKTFPCPVCRRETASHNPDVGKEMWAQQFPTNNHVKKLIDLQSTTGTRNPLCGPCQTTKNVQKKADVWCSATNTFFCDDCKSSFHDVIHKECHIIAVSEDSVTLAQKQPSHMVCDIHKERMDCFCEDHKFIGCNKCIITEHRQCDSVTTTKEYFNKQKNNSNIQSMDKSLVEAANSMDLMVKSFIDKEQDMQRCKQVELDSLIKLRDRLNAYLDKRQMELTQELNSSYKTESEKVDLSKQRCNRLRTAMLGTKEALQMAVKREDDVDTIRLLHRGQTETGACRELLEDYSRSLTSVHIKHDIDSDLHTLNEKSHLSLGKIVIERKPQTLPSGITFVKTLLNSHAKSLNTIKLPMQRLVLISDLQKQLWKPKVRDSLASVRRVRRRERKEMRIRRYETTHDKTDTKIVADKRNPGVQVVLLSTGLIVVFSDQSYIWLISEDGQELDKFQTQWNPQALCVLDADTIAVTSGYQSLQIVGVQANKLRQLHLIQTSIRCYGITNVNQQFMVSTPEDIYMMGRDGQALKVHSLGKPCHRLVYDPLYEQAFAILSNKQNDEYDDDSDDDMEMVAYGSSNVSAISTEVVSLMEQPVNIQCNPISPKRSPARGTTLVQKAILNEGVVKNATGVTVDREGNVYICDQVSNNVVQLSADGSKVRKLLTSEDGINSPTAISMYGDKLVVTSLSPQQEKVIHVFRLN